MSRANEPAGRFRSPPPQQNLARATELGFEALSRQTADQLGWLGVEAEADRWRVPVLNDALLVDRSARKIVTAAGQEVGPHWRILVLHYVAIEGRPESQTPSVTFADLATARSYNSVYEARTLGRLCATTGREEAKLRAAAEALGGRVVNGGGDLGYDFDLFPRLVHRLVWYAPDDEFPPSATILLPENIESYFCAEDIVVLSERLVSRICGRPF